MVINAMGKLEERMLDVMQGQDWLTRRQIGERLNDGGKLSPYQVSALNLLVARGLVEVEERWRGATAYFVYRVKEV